MKFFLTKSQRKRYWLKFRIKLYAVLFSIILVLIGGIYFVRQTDYFSLKKIEVVGLEGKTQPEFLNELLPKIFEFKLAKFLGPNNYFSWKNDIEYSNYELASLDIVKDFTKRKVLINVDYRKKLGIWCVIRSKAKEMKTENERMDLKSDLFIFDGDLKEERCWWFDEKDGILMERSPSAKGQLIFKIEEDAEEFPKLGHSVLPFENFDNLKKILNSLGDIGFSFKNLKINQTLQELEAVTNGNNSIIFSLRFDPTTHSIPALKDLLKNTPIKKIDYLDLTVENKIYLKKR